MRLTQQPAVAVVVDPPETRLLLHSRQLLVAVAVPAVAVAAVAVLVAVAVLPLAATRQLVADSPQQQLQRQPQPPIVPSTVQTRRFVDADIWVIWL